MSQRLPLFEPAYNTRSGLMARADHVLRRESPLWLMVSIILFLLAIAGVFVEAGPTAFVGAVLVVVTLVVRLPHRDATRLVVASILLLALGVSAAVIPTAEGCGVPLIESAQHSTEPTPHVHGPCEQGNDRRTFAGVVLIIGAGAAAFPPVVGANSAWPRESWACRLPKLMKENGLRFP